MKKIWKKSNDFTYDILKHGSVSGTMELHANSAHFIIENKKYEIKLTGFWKNNVEISDAGGNVILRAYPEKWYANTSIIEFGDRKLKLIVHNNPLAEYLITEDEKGILAYGLDADNGKLIVRITDHTENDIILDFMLWYLFLPIANENFGSNYSFVNR